MSICVIYSWEEPNRDHFEHCPFLAVYRKSIPASYMIEKGRTRGEQFEPAAADQQINWWVLIPTDAKTAAFARIEHTEHTT